MRKYTLALAAVALGLAMAAPARAITYGEPDGNEHPYVGALVGTFNGQQYPYCSGTLVSPTVFVTAAHCDIGTSIVYVTFDAAYTAQAKLYRGAYHADPLYTSAQNIVHDIAVVVFDKPIRGITPARLPTAGLFDQMKAAGTLNNGTRFTAVGYGGQERNFDAQGAPLIAYEDTREVAVSSYNALGPGYLRLSQNQAHGDGGTCYGDSGGPNFLGAGPNETNVIAGTTITGDSQCVSTNVIYRLDTPAARGFLGQYVTLP